MTPRHASAHLTPQRARELLALRGPARAMPISQAAPPRIGPGRFGRPHPRGLTRAEAAEVEARWAAMPRDTTWMATFFTFLEARP